MTKDETLPAGIGQAVDFLEEAGFGDQVEWLRTVLAKAEIRTEGKGFVFEGISLARLADNMHRLLNTAKGLSIEDCRYLSTAYRLCRHLSGSDRDDLFFPMLRAPADPKTHPWLMVEIPDREQRTVDVICPLCVPASLNGRPRISEFTLNTFLPSDFLPSGRVTMYANHFEGEMPTYATSPILYTGFCRECSTWLMG